MSSYSVHDHQSAVEQPIRPSAVNKSSTARFLDAVITIWYHSHDGAHLASNGRPDHGPTNGRPEAFQ